MYIYSNSKLVEFVSGSMNKLVLKYKVFLCFDYPVLKKKNTLFKFEIDFW